jgi:aspartyl-tRNA(Asn)/glutamyl-tRNA(Gln) amidotransferase subunit C
VSRSFSREDVAAIARLARLELTEAEIDLFALQLTGILAYVDQIRDVDTTGAANTAAAGAPLRDDDVQRSLPRDEILRQAPDAADSGFFKVPRVLS